MTTPAGWYDDPENPHAQRYWDGRSWTPHRQAKPAPQPIPRPAPFPPPSPFPPAPAGPQPQWSPPGQPPGVTPRRSRTPLIIAVAVAAVVIGGIVSVVVFLSLFGQKTIVADKAAKTLTNAVSRQNGFIPTDTSCPSGVKAKVGATFECHFTGPDGTKVTSHMKVTKVNGDDVELDMRWGEDGE
ncbi:DUF2510 domain-containing protein [Mycobacterium alsense]|uniref:DUF2510 domain-containing protein n=1 Tax=Mycobacterium alsense TaxID=324058 RepID=UPI0009ED9F39|nr:DUF2510 domain-containing protein [Mycobacterium alsense]